MGYVNNITIDGRDFRAVEQEASCNECAFQFDRAGCLEANSIISCTGERGIIWKEYKTVPWVADIQPAQSAQSEQIQDSIVAEIRELLLQRSETGIAKYGTTLDRKDLKPSEWCQHLLEELLDASGYVLRLKKDLESIEKITAGPKE